MTVDFADVDCAAGPTAGAGNIEPRHASSHGRADRRRPPHIAASGKFVIPAYDDAFGVLARGRARGLLRGDPA
jgi:hypothetical protein